MLLLLASHAISPLFLFLLLRQVWAEAEQNTEELAGNMADELKQEQDASRAATRAAEEDEHKAQLEAVRLETERKVSAMLRRRAPHVASDFA